MIDTGGKMERVKRKKRQKSFLELIADSAEKLASINDSIEVYEEVKDIFLKIDKLIKDVNNGKYSDKYEENK